MRISAGVSGCVGNVENITGLKFQRWKFSKMAALFRAAALPLLWGLNSCTDEQT